CNDTRHASSTIFLQKIQRAKLQTAPTATITMTLYHFLLFIISALLSLVQSTLAQQQCLKSLIKEINTVVSGKLVEVGVQEKYQVIFTSTFISGLLCVLSICIGIATYDSALKRDWVKELEEHETARHTAKVRAVCALHGVSACACMGKYILGRAVDGTITQEQDANELWAQQMKPTEANEEYRDHVD
ncbi:hypothetical protein BOX15_Mlig028262g1, partial [Macrostomum lignano]